MVAKGKCHRAKVRGSDARTPETSVGAFSRTAPGHPHFTFLPQRKTVQNLWAHERPWSMPKPISGTGCTAVTHDYPCIASQLSSAIQSLISRTSDTSEERKRIIVRGCPGFPSYATPWSLKSQGSTYNVHSGNRRLSLTCHCGRASTDLHSRHHSGNKNL